LYGFADPRPACERAGRFGSHERSSDPAAKRRDPIGWDL